MTPASSFYENQSQARGVNSKRDVETLASQSAVVYDRLLLPSLRKSQQPSIYEAATGPGILQSWFAKHGFTAVEGSDISSNEVELARQINPRITCSDSLTHLETLGSDKFDCIVALDFMEHLPREDFRRFLMISHKALKHGGVLILRGPNGDSPFVGLNLFNDITHVWAYTSVACRVLLELAGFSRIWFADDTTLAIHKHRLIKLPLMKISQFLLRSIIYWATRQRISHFGASLYVYAEKA